MKVTSAQAQPGGKFLVSFDHQEPITLGTEGETPQDVAFSEWIMAGNTPSPYQPNHAELRAAAFARINLAHADFLRDLTGNATTEERDTWKAKEEAARALIADAATEGQAAMIGFEAQGAGVEPAALAKVIINKADTFQSLIGMAASFKAKAKAAVTQATDEAVPLEQVPPTLEGIFTQLSDEADAVATQWQVQAV